MTASSAVRQGLSGAPGTADCRLRRIEQIGSGVQLPSYERTQHSAGIVHIGVGAFHRAHQAVYTDDALARAGGDWRIIGISLRGAGVADALLPQDNLYTLLVRDAGGTQARVIGSLAGMIAAATDAPAARRALLDPAIRIVSLTITEKAYGIARGRGGIVDTHPAIAHDLLHPAEPLGAIGMMVDALSRRRQAGIAPFTVLCCDNLPENGRLLRAGMLDFASRLDAGLAEWIAREVAFPDTMVDRITPASSAATLEEAQNRIGCRDLAAVETEAFSQWVIEDHFPSGRPAWELAGALMVSEVAPYERMKLRMLNGAHSLLAYAGTAIGFRHVRDAMQDGAMIALVRRYMAQAALTLGSLPDIDVVQYEHDLVTRFSNPAIAHQLGQIAMDGTEKLPQRILAPAMEALAGGDDIRLFAFAAAAWMRFCVGRSERGERYALDDPRAEEINDRLQGKTSDACALADALLNMPGLFPDALRQSELWRQQVTGQLGVMLARGMRQAIADVV